MYLYTGNSGQSKKEEKRKNTEKNKRKNRVAVQPSTLLLI